MNAPLIAFDLDWATNYHWAKDRLTDSRRPTYRRRRIARYMMDSFFADGNGIRLQTVEIDRQADQDAILEAENLSLRLRPTSFRLRLKQTPNQLIYDSTTRRTDMTPKSRKR